MDKITDVSVTPCSSSKYIKPIRMHYKQSICRIYGIFASQGLIDATTTATLACRITKAVLFLQNGSAKTWDVINVHDSVAVLLYNKSREVFVFVKQFRPAIYISSCEVTSENQQIDVHKYPGELGITYELCAGLIDKDKSPIETAKAEVFEECGYDVPLSTIEKISSFRSGVGTSGARQTMFYAEVTDQMRTGKGGGLVEEGEMIDIVDIPVTKAMEFIMDESINKPVGMMYAIMWFFQVKWKN